MRTGQDRGQVKFVLSMLALCIPGGTGCGGQCVERSASPKMSWDK